MASIIKGLVSDDILTIQLDTTIVQGGVGVDTVVLSGNYEDYIMSFPGSGGAVIVDDRAGQPALHWQF